MPLWSLLLLGSLSLASSFPPPHLRAVEVPPRSWHRVFGSRRQVVLYWDGEERYGVEVYEGGRWRRVEREAASGWTSPTLPRGVGLRLVDGAGEASPTLHPASVASPAVVASLEGRRRSLAGGNVVDIEVDPQGRAWVATLQGGLAVVDPGRRRLLGPWGWGWSVRTLTREDGLPSDRVVSVLPQEDGGWVGTAGGLARLEWKRRPGRDRLEVTRVLTVEDGLPDNYVQALALEGDRLWVGTFRGLARVDGAAPSAGEGEAWRVETILQPWSVFALGRGPDGAWWTGYEGLRRVPEGDPVMGVPSETDVYDLELLTAADGQPRPAVLLATLQQGVVLLEEGEPRTVWPGSASDGAYAIARIPGGWAVAGASRGLQEITETWHLERHWGRAQMLPSDTVNEVVPDLPSQNPSLVEGVSRKVWVGTDRGVARLDVLSGKVESVPLARVAAGAPFNHLEARGHRALLAGADGPAFAGPWPHRRLREGAWSNDGLVDILRIGNTTWWVYQDRVVQSRRLGKDRSHRLPFLLKTAAVVDGVVWVGGEHGALRFDERIQRFTEVTGLTRVDRLRAGEGGTLWAIANDVVVSLSPSLKMRTYIQAHRPLDLWPDGNVIWVGTENGLDVVQVQTGHSLGLLRSADRKVTIPAVAADGVGGCWVATDGGQVIHLDTTLQGGASILELEPHEPPEIQEIVPVAGGGAWVRTNHGVWAVQRPAVR